MVASTEMTELDPYAPSGKLVHLFFPHKGEALDAFEQLNGIQKTYGYFTYNDVLSIFGLTSLSKYEFENHVWTEPLTVEKNLAAGNRLKLSRPVPKPSTDDFTFRFDSNCENWDKSTVSNIVFLRQVRSHLNMFLNARGYMFLNEVLRQLGIPPIFPQGQTYGWIHKIEGDKDQIEFMVAEIEETDFFLVTLKTQGPILDRL